jgi:hypothetical protein
LQVVDALSAHFLAFESEARVMPVVWHQGLLCFVTRYKHQLTAGDRDALQRLTQKQHHHLVRGPAAIEFVWTHFETVCCVNQKQRLTTKQHHHLVRRPAADNMLQMFVKAI